jgi:TatD DNase family protein
MIDSHCHLDFPDFDEDRDEVLARAVEAGVTAVINPGTDLQSSRRAVALTERYDNVYAAVGVHPHDASTLNRQVLAELRQLASHPKVVAIGEIGLDYYRDLSPRAQQRAAFEAQLALAADLGRPVIIHQRESAEDVMAALRDWATGGHPGCVLHAFSGDETMANEAISLGFFIGVGGPLTFKNARQLPEIVTGLPVSCLVVETDAPYLAPHPYRGRRNEPAYVVLVAKRLVELRGTPKIQSGGEVPEGGEVPGGGEVPVGSGVPTERERGEMVFEELSLHLTDNTQRLFRLLSAA